MAEIKRVTLHPLKTDGTVDTDINLYPKTLIDGVVDRQGNPVEVALKSEIPQVPSNVSAFTNDAGYITESAIPTNYVTINTEQNITGFKNFTQGVKLGTPKHSNYEAKIVPNQNNRGLNFFVGEEDSNNNPQHSFQIYYDSNGTDIISRGHFTIRGMDDIEESYGRPSHPEIPNTCTTYLFNTGIFAEDRVDEEKVYTYLFPAKDGIFATTDDCGTKLYKHVLYDTMSMYTWILITTLSTPLDFTILNTYSKLNAYLKTINVIDFRDINNGVLQWNEYDNFYYCVGINSAGELYAAGEDDFDLSNTTDTVTPL